MRRCRFRGVAEEVLAKDKDSEATILRIARFMSDKLYRSDRSIDILMDANRRGLLHEAGQLQLAEFLQPKPFGPNRYDTLIPLLESLAARRPDNLKYVDSLMQAYYATTEQIKCATSEKDRRQPSQERPLARRRNGCASAIRVWRATSMSPPSATSAKRLRTGGGLRRIRAFPSKTRTCLTITTSNTVACPATTPRWPRPIPGWEETAEAVDAAATAI